MTFLRWGRWIGLAAVVIVVFVAWFMWYTMMHTETRVPERLFHINQGETTWSIAERLEDDRFVVSRWLFVAYLWKENLRGRAIAGDYLLNGQMTMPEIAFKLTQGETESLSVTITFPEGWDSHKMADRLTANGLPGADFLILVQQPKPEYRDQFPFLKNIPENASLEGFLFPDTYSFFKKAAAEDIITTMLGDFGMRLAGLNSGNAVVSKHSLFDTVTLASIVENEVKTTADRKLVADLFWRRLAIGQRLESDATVQYVLQGNKVQHSFSDTRVDSPYNTYINNGLPPGPIGNPGLDALTATMYPTSNAALFFLSDPVTGETVFAKTYEEHLRNKKSHGL
ncbi:MAG: endolytic transglycosylase MltG [Candidatus Moraniibacteriota bacterium]